MLKKNTKKNLSTDIKLAVQLLRSGKLVAIPTETVYGLAADASNPEAVKKIFKAKNRPSDHPIIVHIADDSQLSQWAIDIPPIAYQLTKAFWPGPLTLILQKAPHVPDIVTGGQDTIGLRCPSHPIAQSVLYEFKGGLAAPSANHFGHISPTKAEHVLEELGDKIDLILDGGTCDVGIESTILDLTQKQPRLLRPGMINHKAIEKIIGMPVKLNSSISSTQKQAIPRVSGSLPSHYAPTTPTLLMSSEQLKTFINKISNLDEKIEKKHSIGVLARQSIETNIAQKNFLNWIVLSDHSNIFATELYEKMRYLDQLNLDFIVIEDVPNKPEWLGIKDRIKRASSTKNLK